LKKIIDLDKVIYRLLKKKKGVKEVEG